MKKSLSHAFIQPLYFKRSLGMTLFSKKEKEEEASAADIPAAPKRTFQSNPKNTLKNAPQERADDSTTIFGKNLNITGNVSGEGNMIIMGSFEGEFNLKGQLKVSQGAKVKGDFNATSIAINGNVEGNLTAAEKIHMDNTARINGRIVTPKVSILDGAVFDGEMQMGKRSTRASKPAAVESHQSSTESVTAAKNGENLPSAS
ncbi:MAG: polymer-forming cytoskeletal protein [Desulfobacterales bacterium]|jgi:cytoskeletal protein CcmA (bactofilin family)